MPTSRHHFRLSLTTLLTVIILAQVGFSSPNFGLKDEPVIINKTDRYITDLARDFLKEQDQEKVRVWVYFTDKDIFTRKDFQQVASSVTLTERALKRRSKVGRENIVFADLPVAEQYINGITSLGGKLRRASRWLNAASFEVPYSSIDRIGTLSYVSQIKPISSYQNVEPTEITEIGRFDYGSTAQAPDALVYGGSLTQLNQINVPAVHAKGFSGQGVTLAIMDTGFRKTHETFADHISKNRVLGEWDFVFDDGNTSNEAADVSSQWNHGTLIWSVSGGQKDGQMYGPAYKSNFILCKTEDLRSETPVEEDNWVAALEFSDSIGTDVITTSLGYSDWYTFADFDGATATITLAANTADSLGIVMCNSMGNSGPGAGTLTAPADAFNILAVGAVNSLGAIASFSSRGPTFDGRIKPEVCAMGVSTFSASSSGDNLYTGANGTSLSTPLVAGAACLLIEARPTFPPNLIRQALMETASQASTPDNTFGHGIINVEDALDWGADFTADITLGDAPFDVQFTSLSSLSPTSYLWDFGDGNNSSLQNPIHNYSDPGSYTVSLTVQTAFGPITTAKSNFIAAMGDTLIFVSDSTFAGESIDISVNLQNSQPLQSIIIPFDLSDVTVPTQLDTIILGSRTSYFERVNYLSFDPTNERYAIELVADDGGGAPPLATGNGEVLILRLKTDRRTLGDLSDTLTSSLVGTYTASLTSEFTYSPIIQEGLISTKGILRCDVDYSNDGNIDIGDITAMIQYLFLLTYTPPTLQSSDCDADFGTDIGDLTYLIAYLFIDGPPPVTP